MEKMQRDFEDWAADRGLPLRKDGVVVTYPVRATDDAWQAWIGSRSSLAEELRKEEWLLAPCVLQDVIYIAGLEERPEEPSE